MTKKTIFSLLIVISSFSFYAHSQPIGLGKGLADAINATMADERCYELIGQFIDLFFDKISFSDEQWHMLQELLIEGRDLLAKRTDKRFIELKATYDREYQELFEAIFDQETGKLHIEGSEEFLKEALMELQNDERFQPIRDLQRDEQNFNKKVALCLTSDLGPELAGATQSASEEAIILKYDHLKALVERVIISINRKLQQ